MFTSRDNVKKYLFNDTTGTTYDAIIDLFLDQVDALITRETGVATAASAAVTVSNEIVDSRELGYDGIYEIHVKYHPIASITKIEKRASDNSWEEYTDEVVGSIEFDNWRIYPLYQVAGAGHRKLRISYTAGYATANVPKDLVMAATMLVAGLFNARQGVGLKTISMFDFDVALDENEYRYIDRVLKNYTSFSL